MSQLLPRTQDTLERGLSRVPVNPDTGLAYTAEEAYAKMPKITVLFPGAAHDDFFESVPDKYQAVELNPKHYVSHHALLKNIPPDTYYFVYALRGNIEWLVEQQLPFTLVYPAMNAQAVYADYFDMIDSPAVDDWHWVSVIEWLSRAWPGARSVCLSKFEFAPAFGHPKYWYDAPPKGNN